MLDDVLKQFAATNMFHHHEDVCRSADDLIAAAATKTIVTAKITQTFEQNCGIYRRCGERWQ